MRRDYGFCVSMQNILDKPDRYGRAFFGCRAAAYLVQQYKTFVRERRRYLFQICDM